MGSAKQLVASGIEAEKAGDTNEAFDYYQEAIARNGQSKSAHFDIGHIWQTWGQPEQAESEYRTALRLNPNFAPALHNLAELKAETDPAAAIDLSRRLIAVQPDNAVARFNLGVLLYKAGDESGKDLIREAVTAQPQLARQVPPDTTLG